MPIQIKTALALAGSVEQVTVEATDEALENVPASHIDVDQNLWSRLPISSAGQGLSDAITLTSGGVVADSNGFFHPQGDHGETSYVVDGQPISDQQNKTFSTQMPPERVSVARIGQQCSERGVRRQDKPGGERRNTFRARTKTNGQPGLELWFLRHRRRRSHFGISATQMGQFPGSEFQP